METQETRQSGPLPRIEAEAQRLAGALVESTTTAVMVGGVAVYLRCPSAAQPPLQREYKDIDLVTVRPMAQRLTATLVAVGYQPDKRFNALHGGERLFFWDEQNARQLDVFVDRFVMCHGFDLRQRVAVDAGQMTLPLADLLLTKMQVVEINFKDMQDIAALLQDHPLTGDEQGINLDYITGLTRNDWGLQRTLELTIAKLQDGENGERLTAVQPRYSLTGQLADLHRALQEAPKSIGWKLRARIGERKRWYELPEEARA